MERVKKYIRKWGFIQGFQLYIKYKLNFRNFIKVTVPFSEINILLRPSTSDIRVFDSIFIEEYSFDFRYPPKVIIDAGANIGASSIYFSEKYPESQIIALEPEETNFSILKLNTISYPNIICLKKALWFKDEYLMIENPNDHKLSFQVKQSDNYNKSDIEGISINTLIKQFNIQVIDILKMDIEGSEKDIFLYNTEWLDKLSVLFIELHDRKKIGCSRSFYSTTNKYVYEEMYAGGTVIMVMKKYNEELEKLLTKRKNH